MVRSLKPGLYGPLPTFFTDDQEIDYGSYKKHLLSQSVNSIQICQNSRSYLGIRSCDKRNQPSMCRIARRSRAFGKNSYLEFDEPL